MGAMGAELQMGGVGGRLGAMGAELHAAAEGLRFERVVLSKETKACDEAAAAVGVRHASLRPRRP